MKIRFLLFIGIMLQSGISARSQTLFAGIKDGFCNSYIVGDFNGYKGYAHRRGFYYGGMINKSINSDLDLQMEINSLPRGSQRNEVQEITDPARFGIKDVPESTKLYARLNTKTYLNYLEIPFVVKFKFSLSNKIDYYVDLGMDVAYLLEARQIVSGSSFLYLDKNLGVHFIDQNNGLPYSIS